MNYNEDIIDPFLSGAVIELTGGERLLVPIIPRVDTVKVRPYVVQEEDTLLSISSNEFNGNYSVWYYIYLINNLEDPLDLPVGEVINLPVW